MLIGLTGTARCGKDTVADWLIEHRKFARVAFADPIKEMTKSLLSMNSKILEELKDTELHILKITPRRIMQTLGTDWGRNIIHENIWITFARERIDFLNQLGQKNVVIPDVRFDNEAQYIQSMGGVVLHIRRPNQPTVEEHSSELGIARQYINGWIYNSGTVEELYEMLEELFDSLGVTYV